MDSRTSTLEGGRTLMDQFSRRGFVQGVFGLAAVGAGGLVLHPEAQATPASGTLGTYAAYLEEEEKKPPPAAPAKKLPAPEKNILAPFYREGAPSRAKVPPPLEPGN